MEDTPTTNNDDEQMTSSPINDEKNDGGKITFSIDRAADDLLNNDNDGNNHIKSDNQHERKSRLFKHSYSDQHKTDDLIKNQQNQNFLGPYRHSFEHQHQHEKRILPSAITTMSFPTGVPLPMAPYSAASDPGPYHSPWLNTPTNPYNLVNFHFPKSQEHLVASAQGSIAQLSTLTKILCDEPSVFTPISPR